MTYLKKKKMRKTFQYLFFTLLLWEIADILKWPDNVTFIYSSLMVNLIPLKHSTYFFLSCYFEFQTYLSLNILYVSIKQKDFVKHNHSSIIRPSIIVIH